MSDKKLENNGKQTTKKIAYEKPQLNKKAWKKSREHSPLKVAWVPAK